MLLPAIAFALVTKGPWVQHVTQTSAVVRVEVDPPSAVTLELDPHAALDASAPKKIESTEKKAIHSLVVNGLEAQTRYTYTVRGAGASKPGAFTTAPKVDTPFKFVIYGDTRSDDAAHAAVVKGITSVPTDFLINTGDFVGTGDSTRDWQSFFDIESPLLRERCLVTCVGNHEITDGSGILFVRYFGPSELPPPLEGGPFARATVAPEQLQGTFRWGNTRFFLINGMVPYRTGPDRTWLEKALSDSDAEKDVVWRVVVTHHAPWSSGPHGDNALMEAAHLPDIFRSHKIDLIVGGHDHIYERGTADGMPYLISGGGGAPLYKIKAPKPFARKLESVHHFITASVSTAAIDFQVTRIDGSTLERCGLRKGNGWDCDAMNAPPAAGSAPAPSSSSGSSSTRPAETPAPPSSSKCACRLAGDAGTSGGLPVLAGLALALVALARRNVR